MKEEINSFLNYLIVEKGFSENTVAAYRNDLYYLANFAQEEAAKHSFMASWSNFNRERMLSYKLFRQVVVKIRYKHVGTRRNRRRLRRRGIGSRPVQRFARDQPNRGQVYVPREVLALYREESIPVSTSRYV